MDLVNVACKRLYICTRFKGFALCFALISCIMVHFFFPVRLKVINYLN